ncbi:MAG: hypothetical protein ACRDRH_27170 [Pseudonocardia sp.]
MVLDTFEDDSYTLDVVTLKDGRQAFAYTCDGDDRISRGEHDGWDARTFEEQSLTAYIRQCRAWKSRQTEQPIKRER